MNKFAGFPLSAWTFALRTWAAMMLALYATFWLQLENAWLALLTVGILSLQTRGQAYQKAVYRLLTTAVGVVVSIIIAGLFAQARDLFVIAFASWLGLCVYVAGLLDGNRAFGAVLAGFTVAFVAVKEIDSPQNVFMTGVDRGAVIAVGIAALALVNDVFLALAGASVRAMPVQAAAEEWSVEPASCKTANSACLIGLFRSQK
jgi:uncharacterized membrane protein YccC